MILKTLLGLSLLVILSGCSQTRMSVDASPSPGLKSTISLESSSSATPLTQETPNLDDAFLIVAGERMGSITKESTLESLREEFGADEVQETLIYVGEGIEMSGLTIFPNDEKKRVELVWTEEEPKRVQMIRIQGDKSDWATAEGVTLGNSLVEIHEINGATFDLQGLDWDFGGFVTHWNGGKLDGLNLKFGSSSVELSEEDMQAVLGDQIVKSDNESMQRANPSVSEITVNFPPE
jgi:hypothetical protein